MYVSLLLPMQFCKTLLTCLWNQWWRMLHYRSLMFFDYLMINCVCVKLSVFSSVVLYIVSVFIKLFCFEFFLLINRYLVKCYAFYWAKSLEQVISKCKKKIRCWDTAEREGDFWGSGKKGRVGISLYS